MTLWSMVFSAAWKFDDWLGWLVRFSYSTDCFVAERAPRRAPKRGKEVRNTLVDCLALGFCRKSPKRTFSR